ncbi:MAG: type II secretion system protein, partial [Candidatus Riflebacteria bacterium]|nr:type II secretion system protein [Candidatus Riflebacteria bacterium]
ERQRSGVTLVEILIVTVVITLMAAVSFPVYKIIQQREKEKRLKKILNEVRSAIGCRKSALSNRDFVDGYRTFVRNYGLTHINDQASRTYFLRAINRDGYGYPGTIGSLTSPTMFSFEAPIGDGASITIVINRKFMRPRNTADGLPPHPFQSWNPNVAWIKVLKNGHIIDIKSEGAGMALDGSLTDDW